MDIWLLLSIILLLWFISRSNKAENFYQCQYLNNNCPLNRYMKAPQYNIYNEKNMIDQYDANKFVAQNFYLESNGDLYYVYQLPDGKKYQRKIAHGFNKYQKVVFSQDNIYALTNQGDLFWYQFNPSEMKFKEFQHQYHLDNHVPYKTRLGDRHARFVDIIRDQDRIFAVTDNNNLVYFPRGMDQNDPYNKPIIDHNRERLLHGIMKNSRERFNWEHFPNNWLNTINGKKLKNTPYTLPFSLG